jgi:hypothetical protein
MAIASWSGVRDKTGIMLRILALTFLVLALARPLAAAEVCVACDQPAATYRCTLEQMPQGKTFGLEPAAQAHVCEKVLAKMEHHGSCHTIADAKTCDGKSRVVTLTDYQRAIAGDTETTYEPGALEKAQRGMKSTWTCVTSLFSDC